MAAVCPVEIFESLPRQVYGQELAIQDPRALRLDADQSQFAVKAPVRRETKCVVLPF